MLAVPMPTALSSPDRHLAALAPDVVLLTGGDDLVGIAGAQHTTPARDALEARVVAWCDASRVPVIGVCRGMQLLARLSGASLVHVDGHVARRHPVIVRGGPGMTDGEHEVNSYHRYGLAASDLPSNLRPFAWDLDGHVEGFAHRDTPQFGLMWHPERVAASGEWAASVLEVLVRQVAGRG
jgi:putative glutamine amidotransferase